MREGNYSSILLLRYSFIILLVPHSWIQHCLVAPLLSPAAAYTIFLLQDQNHSFWTGSSVSPLKRDMDNPTPPNELAIPTDEYEVKPLETLLTPPSSAPMSRTPTNSLVIIPKLPIVNATVKLTKPVEPLVTYSEMLRFVIWGIFVVLSQLWRDLSSAKFYRPLLSTDFMTHFFVSHRIENFPCSPKKCPDVTQYIPTGRHDPRIVTSGPHNRLTIRDIPLSKNPQFEDTEDLSIFPEREIINCASNNYGGFADLEPGMDKVIEAGLRSLPFCPPPQPLEDLSRTECARYMGFDEAFTAPAGFSTNVLAFATMAGVGAAQGRHVVFLMDRDCHNSMFTGAFYNKGARVHKFNHNDIGDLESKLRMYRDQDPLAFVCVAVEGVYRFVMRLFSAWSVRLILKKHGGRSFPSSCNPSPQTPVQLLATGRRGPFLHGHGLARPRLFQPLARRRVRLLVEVRRCYVLHVFQISGMHRWVRPR